MITGQQRPAGIALLRIDAETGHKSVAKLAPMHRTAGGSCGSEKQHVKASLGRGLSTKKQVLVDAGFEVENND